MTDFITGWKLPEADRDRLLTLFSPCYACVVADHVTLRFGTDEHTPLPTERSARIVGEANDGAGVQALLVEIAGSTLRGDGSHFHITWSLGQGREARESNDVLKAGWQPLDNPIQIDLDPARWRRP